MKRWDILSKHILAKGYKTMVEVGTADGINIFKILNNLGLDNSLKVWCVDPYVAYDKENRDCNGTPAQVVRNRQHAEKNLFQKHENVHHINSGSLEAVKQFEDKSLDLVFIDADHRYEAVVNDIAAWWPKVKPGGTLCGHDYGMKPWRVKDAVDEFIQANDLKVGLEDDFVWVISK